MEPFRLISRGGVIRVTLSGEFGLEITEPLKTRLHEAIQDPTYRFVVVDLADITFMDSSGIGFLVASNTRIHAQGKKMYLFKPSQQIRRILGLVQLESFFDILDDDKDLALLDSE